MWNQFKALDWDQKKFISICFGFSFLLTCDYACLRPAVQSLFITEFGSKTLPLVWLLSLPLNFLIVALFNRFQALLGTRVWTLLFPLSVILLNLGFALSLKAYPGMVFGFYLWKDLYILLMFQQLWSQIQASLGQSEAKGFYGLMYTFGAFGSLAGASLPALLNLSPEAFLFSTLLFYPFILVLQKLLLKNPLHAPMEKKEAPKALHGLKLIQKSGPLITIGLLVAFMQMSSALAEFLFSRHLELHFTDASSRMQATGRVTGLMHALTLSLQVLVSFLAIQKWKNAKGHTWIPMALGSTSIVYLIAPSFATASLGYISCKSLDFSLFAVLKETLYAPLDKGSKYEAKSFIDIFVYRGAKAVMSLALLAFSALQSTLVFGVIFLALTFMWFWVARSRLQETAKMEADLS